MRKIGERKVLGKDYQKLAMRTNDGKSTDRLLKKIKASQGVNDEGITAGDFGGVLEACLGLSGEAGEVQDLIKKWLFQESTLDVQHLKRELGDVLWYVARLCEAFNVDLDEIMEVNIEKLKQRYPNGFEPARSNHRAEGDT